MKLVNLEDVIERLQYWSGGFDYIEVPTDYAVEQMENLPMFEPVKCGECRHFDDRHGEVCHNERFGDGWGNYPPPCVKADGGCSYGERRPDDE